MTDYKFSQLHALGATPASGDLVAILRVSDTSTAPADSSGSNQTVTVAQLLAAYAGGTLAKYLSPAVVSLTYGTSIAVDASAGNAFNLTLTASTGTIANPTNAVDGQVIRFRISQDSTGSRTVTWGTAYDFGAGSAPALTATASKVDIAAFEYKASISKWCFLGIGLGY